MNSTIGSVSLQLAVALQARPGNKVILIMRKKKEFYDLGFAFEFPPSGNNVFNGSHMTGFKIVLYTVYEIGQ